MTIEYVEIGKHLIRKNEDGYYYLLQIGESYVRIIKTLNGIFTDYPAEVSDRERKALATHNPNLSYVNKLEEQKKETVRKGKS